MLKKRNVLVVFSLAGVIALAASAIIVLVIFTPYVRLDNWRQSVRRQLWEHKEHPPEGVSGEEWEFAINWTWTGIANVFYAPEHISNWPRFRVFADALESRLEMPLDICALQWIWDEIEAITVTGRSYSAGYRPVPPIGEAHLDERGRFRFDDAE